MSIHHARNRGTNQEPFSPDRVSDVTDKRLWYNNKWLVGGGAVTALTGVALSAGYFFGRKGDEVNVVPQAVETTIPSTAGSGSTESTGSSPTDLPSSTTSIEPSQSSTETLTPPAYTIEQMRIMPIEEFESISLVDKLSYFSYATKNREQRIAFRSENFGDPNDILVPATTDSTGQEVLNYIDYGVTQAYHDHAVEGQEPLLDRDEAIKSLGGVYVQSGGFEGEAEAYSNIKSDLQSMDSIQRIADTIEFVSEKIVPDVALHGVKVLQTREIIANDLGPDGVSLGTRSYLVSLVEYINDDKETDSTWIVVDKYSS